MHALDGLLSLTSEVLLLGFLSVCRCMRRGVLRRDWRRPPNTCILAHGCGTDPNLDLHLDLHLNSNGWMAVLQVQLAAMRPLAACAGIVRGQGLHLRHVRSNARRSQQQQLQLNCQRAMCPHVHAF
jgi:hypothetical protein